jgi:hypothetical protein
MKHSKIAATLVAGSMTFGASSVSADILDVHMSLPWQTAQS